MPINTSTCCNLALSHSNCSLVTTYTNTCSSLSTVNLTNTTSTNSSSADINSLTRRKKYKKKPAPPIPIKSQQINQQDKKMENKLSNNEISLTAVSSSCSKQLVNKRLNGSLNGSSRLTPHKTPCTSVNHRNKSNVKQRINRILARSLSEAYRLNAKTALNSVQHSFSSEVSLNKRKLFHKHLVSLNIY